MTTDGLPPTFLLIGAPKAGTTSLFEYMGQHPDVFCCPTKEPRFFAVEGMLPPGYKSQLDWIVDSWDDYLALFEGARADQARGEASVPYLHIDGVIERVQARVPDVRLLAILRHPAEAIWSHYLMGRRLAGLTTSLDQMIDDEPLEPLRPDWRFNYRDLVRMRFYHHHLTRWFDAFPPEQLRVFLHEDIEHDPEAVVRQAWEHIGVDPAAALDISERHNVGSEPRSMRLYRFSMRPGRTGRMVKDVLRNVPGRAAVQRRVRGWNEQPTPPLPAPTRQRLLDLFRDDTEALEGLLGRDLSAWKV